MYRESARRPRGRLFVSVDALSRVYGREPVVFMLRPPFFWPRPQHDFELKWRVTRGNASAVWTVVCLNSSMRTRLAPYGMTAHLHCGDSCSGVTKPPDKRMPSSSTLKAPTGPSTYQRRVREGNRNLREYKWLERRNIT